MRDYFLLQRTLWERRFRDWQLAPWVVYLFGPLLFVGLCLLALDRTDYAAYAIALVGLSIVSNLGGQARNDFLRSTYGLDHYRNIRLMENGLVLLPFLLLLLATGFWALTLVQGAVGAALAWRVSRPSNVGAVSTPFSQRPFEFAVGIRRFWWVLPLAAFLLFQAVRVDNLELAVFAYLALILAGCQSCADPEPGFYIWIHTMTPTAFLRRKILLTISHLLLLLLPFGLVFIFFFPSDWLLLLAVTALGPCYLVLWMVFKYAAYPNPINVGHAFIIAIGMLFIPTLLIIIPLYYQKAKSRLAIVLP